MWCLTLSESLIPSLAPELCISQVFFCPAIPRHISVVDHSCCSPFWIAARFSKSSLWIARLFEHYPCPSVTVLLLCSGLRAYLCCSELAARIALSSESITGSPRTKGLSWPWWMLNLGSVSLVHIHYWSCWSFCYWLGCWLRWIHFNYRHPFFFFGFSVSLAVSASAELVSSMQNWDSSCMRQVWSSVPCSSVGGCTDKAEMRFSCEMMEHFVMLWGVQSRPWGQHCTHSVLQQGAERKERLLSHSALSLSFQIALGKWSAVCLRIHPLSGKDPSLPRCERNHRERCKIVAWLFPALGWKSCIIRPQLLWSSSSQSFKNPYKATSCTAFVPGTLPLSASTLVKWNYVLLLHVTQLRATYPVWASLPRHLAPKSLSLSDCSVLHSTGSFGQVAQWAGQLLPALMLPEAGAEMLGDILVPALPLLPCSVTQECLWWLYSHNLMSRSCFQVSPYFLHIASPDADFISSVHLKNSCFTSKVSIMKCWSWGCVSCSKALPCPVLHNSQPSITWTLQEGISNSSCCRGASPGTLCCLGVVLLAGRQPGLAVLWSGGLVLGSWSLIFIHSILCNRGLAM